MRPRILFVDDDPNILDSFRASLRRHFDLDTAEGPLQGLEMVRSCGPYEAVVSDLRMPDMDGVRFLSEVATIQPDAARIMLTGHADLEASMNAVNEGRIFRFLTKPAATAALIKSLEAGVAQYRLVTAVKEKQRQLERDLEAAAYVQRRFLPQTPPDVPGLSVAWRFMPCAELGGDMFHVFVLSPGSLGLYMLDVSGHGAPSALVAVSLSQLLMPQSGYLLRQEAIIPPGEVLAALDRDFPMERFEKHFTIFYGVLDLASGRLRYSGAGHNPPLVLRADGGLERLSRGGPMIGLGFPAAFDEGTVALNAADKLLVYTDGLIQYQAADGGMFSQRRLEACALDRRGLPPERMVEALIAAMLEFGGNALPMDDVSLLCLEMARPGGTETPRS